MRFIHRVVLFSFCLVIQLSVWAYDFEKTGFRYTVTSASNLTVKVESGPRTGDIIIPATVEYNGRVLTVTEIDVSAFEGTEITSVFIPDSVEEIDKYAFCRCQHLKVVRGKVSANIREHAFDKCYQLSSIDITRGCEIIEGAAFAECARLKKVFIPASVERIEANAFYCRVLDLNEDSESRKEIVIEDSLTPLSIVGCPFELSTRKYDGSYYFGRDLKKNTEWNSKYNTTYIYAQKLEFGDYVTNVLDVADAFDHRYLKTVVFGRNIDAIPAFKDAELTKIVVKNPTPPSVKGAFSNYILLNADLFVPKESVEQYKSHPVWKQFNILPL